MGTPLGPKYLPYTYMDPLGEPWLGIYVLVKDLIRSQSFSQTSTFLASASCGCLFPDTLPTGG